jgi:hypothetical protein
MLLARSVRSEGLAVRFQPGIRAVTRNSPPKPGLNASSGEIFSRLSVLSLASISVHSGCSIKRSASAGKRCSNMVQRAIISGDAGLRSSKPIACRMAKAFTIRFITRGLSGRSSVNCISRCSASSSAAREACSTSAFSKAAHRGRHGWTPYRQGAGKPACCPKIADGQQLLARRHQLGSIGTGCRLGLQEAPGEGGCSGRVRSACAYDSLVCRDGPPAALTGDRLDAADPWDEVSGGDAD